MSKRSSVTVRVPTVRPSAGPFRLSWPAVDDRANPVRAETAPPVTAEAVRVAQVERVDARAQLRETAGGRSLGDLGCCHVRQVCPAAQTDRRAGVISSATGASAAGCSTSARTRLARNRAVRTVLPPRVTSLTSTTPAPVRDVDPASGAGGRDLVGAGGAAAGVDDDLDPIALHGCRRSVVVVGGPNRTPVASRRVAHPVGWHFWVRPGDSVSPGSDDPYNPLPSSNIPASHPHFGAILLPTGARNSSMAPKCG